MSDPGHNGGPPMVPLTAKTKLECIRGVLARADLSAAQKCIGAMMIVQADREWSAEMKTAELQQAASAKDRETVFRATKVLDEKGIISKSSARGQSGKYVVLPPKIIEAVVEAFEEGKSSRAKPDHLERKQSGETGRHNQSVNTPKPVGSKPTTSNRSGQTGRVSADRSRAEVSNNIYNNINNLTNNNTSNTELEAARVSATDFDKLANDLFAACNGALDNPVNCQGLASLAIPMMWIEQGCDMQRDILPTLHGYGKSAHGKRIRSWDYFTRGVQKARDARLAGLPAPETGKARTSSRHVPRPEGQSFEQLNAEIIAKIDRGEI